MPFVLLILLVLAGLPAQAAPVLQMRERFNGIKTVTSANPGTQLGTVTGSLFARPGGPRVSGDTSVNSEGWSADTHYASAYNTWTIPYSSNYSGMACGWFYVSQLSTNVGSPALELDFLQVARSDGAPYTTVSINPSGQLEQNNYYTLSTGITCPLNTWVFFAVAWVNDPTTYDTSTYRSYYYIPGVTPGLTQVGPDFIQSAFRAGLTVSAGEFQTNGLGAQMRYGCPSLYSISSFADVVIPSDLIAPPKNATYNWYLNPTTGNDNNDGTSPSTAWKSVDKLNTETSYLGMFPSAGTGPVNTSGSSLGDILHIDCSGGSLVVGTAPITILTPGLTVLETQVANTYGPGLTPAALDLGQNPSHYGIDPTRILPNGTSQWTLLSGTSKVYATTDSGATDLPGCVVWEDAKWMLHPTGTSLSAVYGTGTIQSYLDANPGSYWTDGTTLYVHAFENGVPSNPHVFRRSRFRLAAGGVASAVMINAPNIWWDGLVCAGTTLAGNANGSPSWSNSADDPMGAYCFQWIYGAGTTSCGTNLLSNFNVNYYSKHAIGRTGGGSNSVCTRQNGVYGQGPLTAAGANFGAVTTEVDFSQDSTSTHNQAIFINCHEGGANEGAYNSTAGQIDDFNILSYYQHGSSNFLSLLSFTDCSFNASFADDGQVSQISCTNTTASRLYFSSPATFDRCTCTHGGYTNSPWMGSSQNFTCTNCILIADPSYGVAYVCGNGVFKGCVFDLTPAVNSQNSPLLKPVSTTTTLTVEDCLFLTKAGFAWSPLYGWASTNKISMDHNVYMPLTGGGFTAAQSYTSGGTTSNRTFAQWQALGFDLHSVVTDSPNLKSGTYVPASNNPCLTYGVNIGPLDDYTGTVYPTRETVGAFEVPHVNELNVDLSSGQPDGVTAAGYTATGQSLVANLTFKPTIGTVLTVINNTSSNPISGTFSNLPNGGTINETFNGITYVFTANYKGGSGNDLTLTVTSSFSPPPATDTPLLPPWALWILGAGIFVAGSRGIRRLAKA